MKFTFAAVALASVAFGAQSPLIPDGISSGCSTFLDKLNSDSGLQSCVNPLIKASEVFSPVSNKSASASDVASVLTKVCAPGTGCDDATLRSWLTQFSGSCGAELNSGNKDVLSLYDALYIVSPLKSAVCSVDSAADSTKGQQYCVQTIAASSKSLGNSKLASLTGGSTISDLVYNLVPIAKRFFDERALTKASIITPNAATYKDTNLPFLFLQASMPKEKLCTPCTRAIFVSYLKWESNQPYSIGLLKSPILGGQGKLYDAVKATCGAGFSSAIETEAGVGVAATNGAFATAGAPAFATLLAGAVALVFLA